MKKISLLFLFYFILQLAYSQIIQINQNYSNLLNNVSQHHVIDEKERLVSYKCNYTANGYVDNLSEKDFVKKKEYIDKIIINFKNKPNFSKGYTDTLNLNLLGREFAFDKDVSLPVYSATQY